MKPSAIVSAFLLTLLAAGPVRAQAPIPLTMEDAVARAMDASHRLAEMRAREQGALAAIEVRRSAERPTVGVTSSAKCRVP